MKYLRFVQSRFLRLVFGRDHGGTRPAEPSQPVLGVVRAGARSAASSWCSACPRPPCACILRRRHSPATSKRRDLQSSATRDLQPATCTFGDAIFFEKIHGSHDLLHFSIKVLTFQFLSKINYACRFVVGFSNPNLGSCPFFSGCLDFRARRSRF